MVIQGDTSYAYIVTAFNKADLNVTLNTDSFMLAILKEKMW